MKCNNQLGLFTAFSILFAITLAAYWNSFHVPLVFDDLVTIQRNVMVRGGEINWNFSGILGARSVLYATFNLNYWLHGQDVFGYHVFGFLLHLINGFLVFMLADRLLRNRKYAVLAAAFFLVHPIQTEAVTYISSRSELLSTFFYLSALLIFASWRKERGFMCAIAVGVLFVLGIGSKETVLTLPAAIFLYDYLFMAKCGLRSILSRWRFYTSYLVGGVAAAYYLLTGPLKASIGADIPGHLSSWHYFLTQQRVIARYIRLIFWPAGLNLDYDFRPSSSPLELSVIVAFLFLVVLAALGWKLRRRAPVASFSIFWFFVTLAPTSSVLPIIDVIFEHRLYLPLVGVCLSFPLLVNWTLRQAGFAVSCILILAMISCSVNRNYVWSDEARVIEFWR